MNLTGTEAILFHSDITAEFAQKYESSRAFRERFRVWTALFRQYIKATDQVMDLGCGPGIFSRYLADTGCTVTGIDGSQSMIDWCRKETHTVSRAKYVVGVLPLPDPMTYDRQDVIIASSLLEYIDDMPALLQQIDGLLRPGGLFIASIPNKRSLYRRVEPVIFWLTGRPRYMAYLRNVSTEASFNRQLNNLGFEHLKTIYFAGYDPLSRLLKPFLPNQFVSNLFAGVYRKRPLPAYENY